MGEGNLASGGRYYSLLAIVLVGLGYADIIIALCTIGLPTAIKIDVM